MTDWENRAKNLGYADERTMWETLYLTNSISQLASTLGSSTNSVRERLRLNGVQARGPGGPNNRRLVLTDEIAHRCETEGTAAVARSLNVSYTTLHKALKKRTISLLSEALTSVEQNLRSSPDSEPLPPADSSGQPQSEEEELE